MLDVSNPHSLLYHPGQLLPNPTVLKGAYDTAVEDIAHSRGREVPQDGHAREAQERAFDAFLSAAVTACSAIVAQSNPEGSWGPVLPSAARS